MKSFLDAFRFFTIFHRTNRPKPKSEPISTSFFPLGGFFLGLVLVLFNWLLDPYLSSEIVSVLLVAVLILITRALSLEGLKICFDDFGREGDRAVGISGLIAVLIVVALKFRAIEVMGEARIEGLLLAPMLGRWAMVILAYGSEPIGERLGPVMIAPVRPVHLLVATALALCLVTVFSNRLGLWIALWISFLALFGRGYFHRSAEPLSLAHLGAIGEISEALALVLFASI